jgi:hypothetical protein
MRSVARWSDGPMRALTVLGGGLRTADTAERSQSQLLPALGVGPSRAGPLSTSPEPPSNTRFRSDIPTAPRQVIRAPASRVAKQRGVAISL